tara:strand:+ start:99 stop:1457 length:1359 start_codon:yes stop_codon:yes gene_type:complete
MKRKIIVLAVLTLLLMGLVSGLSALSTQDDPIIGDVNIQISLLNQDPDPVLPGDSVVVRFKVENYGRKAIKDVDVTIKPEYPLSLVEGEEATKRILSLDSRQIEDDSVTLKWNLKTDGSATVETANIDFTYTLDRYEIKVEDFMVMLDQKGTILSIVSVDSLPSQVVPGGKAKLNIAVKNLAHSLIRDVQFTLDLDDTPFTVFGTANEKVIDRLLPDQQETVSFDILTDPDATLKVESVPLKVTFLDEDNDRQSKSITFGLKVNEEPAYVFNLEQSDVRFPGKVAKFVVSVSNTGVGNMKFVTIDLLPSDHYEILSTNKLYLGNLESDDFETAEFEIFVEESVEGEFPLLFGVDYKDDFNEPFLSQEQASVRVLDKASAKRFGYVEGTNITNLIILLSFAGLVAVFWLYMLIDLHHSNLPSQKKYLWFLAMIVGTLLGAVAYFFLGRKRKQG